MTFSMLFPTLPDKRREKLEFMIVEWDPGRGFVKRRSRRRRS